MRALAIIGVLALGCDDSGVQAKVADVLAYGAVEAQISCQFTFQTSPYSYNAVRLVDGSTIASACIADQGDTCMTRFCGREESCSEVAAVFFKEGISFSTGSPCANDAQTSVYAESGDIVLCRSGGGTPLPTFDISTYCTGRNLGAFD